MSKLLVVFGATGQQGGSIVNHVLNDPELSKQYTIRAVTRNPTGSAGHTLYKRGVEVVKANMDDPESLVPALKGAHTVFGVTLSEFDEHLKSREFRQGKNIADAAATAGAQYFIWSTTAPMGKISGGKLKHGHHLDSKAEIEDYIRTLPLKGIFFGPGIFMQNFEGPVQPRPLGDGTYAMFNCVKPDTLLPLIDTAADTGKYIGAILADPDKFEGKFCACATSLYTFGDVAKVISEKTGKTVVYKQLPREKYESYMPPIMGPAIADMYMFIQDYGYYGPGTKEKVEWMAEQVRGKLNTPQSFFQQSPLTLE